MRNLSVVVTRGLVLVAVSLVSVQAQPAMAQGFLESLFGFLGPKPKRQQPVEERSGPSSGAARVNPFPSAGRPGPSYGGGGSYKTMCVRLCDGFYFPMSSSVSRRDFYRDAARCQSRCDSETKLFYMSKSAGSIEAARDQTGLRYRDLRNAFLYRKALDKSCTCRPAPWSVSERARHERYAMIEAGKLDPASEAGPGSEQPAAVAGVALPQEREAVGEVRPVPVAARPIPVARPAPQRAVRQAPQPKFGLGALFGGPAPASGKPFKHKFRWPGDDGN